MEAASALMSLRTAVAALEAAAAREDWDSVGEQLARQHRFLQHWLPGCTTLEAEARAGLNDILDRYLRLTAELEAARERARLAALRPALPPPNRAERAYLAAVG
jgi:hypothetical protein